MRLRAHALVVSHPPPRSVAPPFTAPTGAEQKTAPKQKEWRLSAPRRSAPPFMLSVSVSPALPSTLYTPAFHPPYYSVLFLLAYKGFASRYATLDAQKPHALTQTAEKAPFIAHKSTITYFEYVTNTTILYIYQ